MKLFKETDANVFILAEDDANLSESMKCIASGELSKLLRDIRSNVFNSTIRTLTLKNMALSIPVFMQINETLQDIWLLTLIFDQCTITLDGLQTKDLHRITLANKLVFQNKCSINELNSPDYYPLLQYFSKTFLFDYDVIMQNLLNVLIPWDLSITVNITAADIAHHGMANIIANFKGELISAEFKFSDDVTYEVEQKIIDACNDDDKDGFLAASKAASRAKSQEQFNALHYKDELKQVNEEINLRSDGLAWAEYYNGKESLPVPIEFSPRLIELLKLKNSGSCSISFIDTLIEKIHTLEDKAEKLNFYVLPLNEVTGKNILELIFPERYQQAVKKRRTELGSGSYAAIFSPVVSELCHDKAMKRAVEAARQDQVTRLGF